MNGVLGYGFAMCKAVLRLRITWANDIKMKCMTFKAMIWHCKAILGITLAILMNFGRNLAPGAGSIAGPIDLQSCILKLCYNQ